MKILIALFFPMALIGQSNCSPFHKTKRICGGDQVKLTASFGACYHYNAITYGMRYKATFVDAVLMTRTERMPMMDGEQYGIIGYSNILEGGVGVMTNGGVGMVGIAYPFTDGLLLSMRIYNTTQRMTHITIGVRVEI